MGLLSKIFATKPGKSKPTELQLSLDDLANWLADKRKEEFQPFLKEGEDFGLEMVEVSKNLVEMGSELASATIKESKQIKELNANVQSAKGTVAKKLMTAFSTIKPWSLAEFGEMVAAQAEIAQTLNGVAGVIKAHGRYVTYFFKDDLRKIQSELGKMEKLSSDLAKHISEKKPRFDSITDLIGAAETYGSIQTSVLADKATLSDLNEALAGARRDQSNLLSKIKEVEQTEGFKSSSGTKQKVDALESDVSGLNTTFEADMTRVNKPLRKYLYSASLNKNQQKLLGDYLKSPSETILIDSDLAIIPILSDVGEEMGKLEGNPKQSEKMKNHLKVLISSIPDTKQRLQEITEQIQENRASTLTDEVRRHGDLKDEDLRRKRIIEEQEESVKRLKSKIEQDENNLKGLQTKLVEKMDEMFSIRIHDDRK